MSISEQDVATFFKKGQQMLISYWKDKEPKFNQKKYTDRVGTVGN